MQNTPATGQLVWTPEEGWTEGKYTTRTIVERDARGRLKIRTILTPVAAE